uniref:Sema domain-containing protein n=1 Tax=Glossina pallidipes TaxID=7398 RepID=A0A1A9ZD48_GLOPL
MITSRLSSFAGYRFTQIAVDAQIKTPGGKTYDVIFVGTDHGKIIKSVNAESADSDKKVTSVVIEEIDVLPKSEPIRNLEIVRTMQYGKINSKDANVGEQKGYRDDMGLLDQRRQSKDQEMINIMQDKNFEVFNALTDSQ